MDNNHPVIIAPSILSANFLNLGEDVSNIVSAGADWLHIDVMDGHFVRNLSMGPCILHACKKVSPIPLDVHLMISNPDVSIDSYIKAGADIITIHAEATSHLHRSLQFIRENGCKAGVAINPATPINSIEWVLDLVDIVLILGTNPGFSGQKYIPQVTTKIKMLRNYLDEKLSPALIEIDGGVSTENLSEIIRAGVNVIVAGSYVFHHPEGIKGGIDSIRHNEKNYLV